METYTVEALAQLRDPRLFSWPIVTLLGLCIYVYAVEVERAQWRVILAGLAFWSMDWINEVVNAVIQHVFGNAIWTATGRTSLQILIGLNLEISLLFLFGGIAFVKSLPKDKNQRILGVPNRWFFVFAFSAFCVLVELYLHAAGTFHWHYAWWNEKNPWLILPLGYGTFYAAAAWVHDRPTLRQQVTGCALFAGTAAVLVVVFGPILGWI